MAYQKQTFKDNETVLKAEHLNHIEDGIVALENTMNDSNGVSIPNGAQVGQIIQVSKIDKNKKPIEWVAVDLPTEILGGSLISPDGSEWLLTVTNDGSLIPVKQWKDNITLEDGVMTVYSLQNGAAQIDDVLDIA